MRQRIYLYSRQKAKIIQVYNDLIEIAKGEGIRVYHGKRTKNDAIMVPQEKWMHVDSDLKYTLRGCYMLAHELGHYVDYMDYKYPEYWHGHKYAYGVYVPVPVIRKVEWSATMFAKRILKLSGLDISKLWREFDKKTFEYNPSYMPFWIRAYNGLK